MNTHRIILLSASFSLLLGCAHAPPNELVAARAASARAAEGPSEQYTPAALHVANESLAVAEQSFADKDDPALVRDLAYIAMRQIEIAESAARTAMAELGIVASESREERLEDADARKTKSALVAVTAALDDQERTNATTALALADEQRRRAEAEQRATRAREDLARIATIKSDSQGMTITLSGSVLFASNRYVLLPAAQAKLSQVAEALLAGDPEATFVVRGHTDSQGEAQTNQVLSVNRAKAVRDYLIGHEIAADRISAEGFGEDRTIGDNSSAEGRANNRRVEIVVSNPK